MGQTTDSYTRSQASCPTPTSPEPFGERYFKSGNYLTYMHREESYHRMAAEISQFLGTAGLKESFRHLDYGCGPGFFVNAMSRLGWVSRGFDISEWAIRTAGDSKGFTGRVFTNVRSEALADNHYLTTCLDVLEHMRFADLCRLLTELQTKLLLVRIPVAAQDRGPMILKTAQSDPTHITRLTKKTWEEMFYGFGYRPLLRLNLYTIWDSDGVLAGVYRKDG